MPSKDKHQQMIWEVWFRSSNMNRSGYCWCIPMSRFIDQHLSCFMVWEEDSLRMLSISSSSGLLIKVSSQMRVLFFICYTTFYWTRYDHMRSAFPSVLSYVGHWFPDPNCLIGELTLRRFWLELSCKNSWCEETTGRPKMIVQNWSSLGPRTICFLPSSTTFSSAENQYHSVYGVLNHCRTAQGQRLLAQWLRQPLTDISMIGMCAVAM